MPNVNHIFATQVRGSTHGGWGEPRCVLEPGMLLQVEKRHLTCSGALRGSSVPWQQGGRQAMQGWLGSCCTGRHPGTRSLLWDPIG